MLPALLVVAPVTVRFAFSRARLAHDEWEPAYKLSSGQSWWRCVRLAVERGQLHVCAERLAKHLSWQLGEQVTLTNIRPLLAGYAAYHHLSVRTAWADWGRLVQAGWLAPTRAPANQGPGCPQGPGSGQAARYVLTAPVALVDQLWRWSRRSAATSLDTSSSKEGSPSPSVPPPRQDHQRGWITLSDPTATQCRDASALLAGCHQPWRRQRPERALLTRSDWQQLLPLIAQVQHQRPEVLLAALLTDRVASARHLPAVLAWRLWRLLRTSWQQQVHRQEAPTQNAQPRHVEDSHDWQEHLPAVRALGGPAAVRAALQPKHHRPIAPRHTPPMAQPTTPPQRHLTPPPDVGDQP